MKTEQTMIVSLDGLPQACIPFPADGLLPMKPTDILRDFAFVYEIPLEKLSIRLLPIITVKELKSDKEGIESHK